MGRGLQTLGFGSSVAATYSSALRTILSLIHEPTESDIRS